MIEEKFRPSPQRTDRDYLSTPDGKDADTDDPVWWHVQQACLMLPSSIFDRSERMSSRALPKGSAKPSSRAGRCENRHVGDHLRSKASMFRLRSWERCQSGIRVWHLSRHPAYKLDHPATSESFLQEALAVAKELKIPHVYGGNSRQDQDTYCPECSALLIKRFPHHVKTFLQAGKCTCSHQLYGDMGS